jgi:predicted metal-dependent hydrolase
MPAAESEVLSLPHGLTQIEWRRSQRARRVSLRIDPRGGSVVVTLPMRAGRRAGMSLLTAQADWVSARLAALPGATRFADGATIPLHGTPRVIRHMPHSRGTVWCEGGDILVAGEIDHLSRRVGDFFRAEARRAFAALAAAQAIAADVTPRRIIVKDTRSRWGSCSASGDLAFSWRLVMAPRFVQDYVAAHEVAHLRHMNHSPVFWELVATLSPHVDAAIQWLRTEGPRLLRVG